MKKVGIFGIISILILIVVVISGCTSSTGGSKNSISVSNVQAVDNSYGSSGFYDVTADIVPKQNIGYLQMSVTAYDSSGAVIEKTPMAWNYNDAVAGQTIKAKGMVSLYQKGTPVKMDVMISDTFSNDPSNAIYKTTINL